jgi:uncharacterized membrane-anchored protein
MIRGTLRADPRTKDLVKRLRPGDIALIQHRDLDAVAARALVERRVAAVVNASPSISGRYPNQGPSVLLEAEVPLLDEVGEEFFAAARTREGAAAELVGEELRLDGGLVGRGHLMDRSQIAQRLEEARKNLSHELDAFARNTLEYLTEEKALLLDPVAVPPLRTKIADRHALVVVRGEGYKEDLRTIEPYLRDVRPVLIGVDGGADALLEVGLRPDIIVGDMDSVSDEALRCGAELVVHGYVRGSREAPGLERLEKLGLSGHVFHAPGTSEDVAMLLADQLGASLIVAVGTHFSMIDFLEKGRGGMASTFLVRLLIGAKLVDAKGTGRLWTSKRGSRLSFKEALMLTLAAAFPLAVIVYYSPVFRSLINTLRLSFR